MIETQQQVNFVSAQKQIQTHSQSRAVSNSRLTGTAMSSSTINVDHESHSVFKKTQISNTGSTGGAMDCFKVQLSKATHQPQIALIPNVTQPLTHKQVHRKNNQPSLNQTTLHNQKSCDHLRIKRGQVTSSEVNTTVMHEQHKGLLDIKTALGVASGTASKGLVGNFTTTAAAAASCVSQSNYVQRDDTFTNVVRNKQIDASKQAFINHHSNCLQKNQHHHNSITALNDITGIIFNNFKQHQKPLVKHKRMQSKRSVERESLEVKSMIKDPSNKLYRVRSNGHNTTTTCDVSGSITKNSNTLLPVSKYKVARISSNGVFHKNKKLMQDRENDMKYFLNNKNTTDPLKNQRAIKHGVPTLKQPQTKHFGQHNLSSVGSNSHLSAASTAAETTNQTKTNANKKRQSGHQMRQKSFLSNENVLTNECRENKAYKVNQLQLQRLQQRISKEKSRSEVSNELMSEPSSKATESTTCQSQTTTQKSKSPQDNTKSQRNQELLRQFKSKLQTANRNQAEQEQVDMQKFLLQREATSHRLENLLQSPLCDHNVSRDYRTKMVDWMVEVMTSFKCSKRAYFLAVKILDEYLTKMQGLQVIENQDVHAIGVTAMYLASKYEDIYPLHSKIVANKIAHGALTQKEILQAEDDYLRLFGFQLDFVTPLEFHQTFSSILSRRLSFNIEKLNELSMLLVKMSLQNVNFCKYQYSLIVLASYHAAIKMLVENKWHNQGTMEDVKRQVFALLKENRDFGGLTVTQQELENVSQQLIEFHRIFDQWHCGLNQLKAFSSLSFKLN